MTNVFFSKSDSSIITFQYKAFEFFDFNPLHSIVYIHNIHHYIIEKQERIYTPNHPYRFLIIGGSGSGKTNVLLNLIKNQRPDVDEIYLYVKDPFE